MPTYLCHGFRWERYTIRVFVGKEDLEDVAADWIIAPASSLSILQRFQKLYDFVPRVQGVTAPGTPSTSGIAEESTATAKIPARDEDGILCHTWSPVKLLEEHDITETACATRPYAYVADHVVRVDLGLDVVAEMERYNSRVTGTGGKQTMESKEGEKKTGGEGGSKAQEGGGWFEKLRDALQKDQEVRWYVVVCDDLERGVSDGEEEEDDADFGEEDGGEEEEEEEVVGNTSRKEAQLPLRLPQQAAK